MTGDHGDPAGGPLSADLAHDISGRWTKELSESRGRGLPSSEAVADLSVPGVLPPDAGVLSPATHREFTSLDEARVFEP